MTLYKYCKRCGKRLKGEENRIRGYGKTCFLRVRKEAEKDLRMIVPLGNYPIEIISESAQEREIFQRSSKQESKPKAKRLFNQEQSIKASQESKGASVQNFQEQERGKRG